MYYSQSFVFVFRIFCVLVLGIGSMQSLRAQSENSYDYERIRERALNGDLQGAVDELVEINHSVSDESKDYFRTKQLAGELANHVGNYEQVLKSLSPQLDRVDKHLGDSSLIAIRCYLEVGRALVSKGDGGDALFTMLACKMDKIGQVSSLDMKYLGNIYTYYSQILAYQIATTDDSAKVKSLENRQDNILAKAKEAYLSYDDTDENRIGFRHLLLQAKSQLKDQQALSQFRYSQTKWNKYLRDSAANAQIEGVRMLDKAIEIEELKLANLLTAPQPYTPKIMRFLATTHNNLYSFHALNSYYFNQIVIEGKASQLELKKAKYYRKQAELNKAKLLELNAFNPFLELELTQLNVLLRLANDDLDTALTTINSSIGLLYPSWDSKDILSVPQGKLVENNTQANMMALELLGTKAGILDTLAMKQNEQALQHKFMESSLQHTEACYEIVSQLVSTFLHKNARRKVINSSQQLSEAGVICALRLYEATGDIQYVERALILAEKSKYSLLLGTIKQFTTRYLNRLLESKYADKSKIQSLISQADSIKKYKNAAIDCSTSQKWLSLKLAFEKELKAVMLRHKPKLIGMDQLGQLDIKKIQQEMPEDQSIIEYFNAGVNGTGYYYACYIDKEQVSLVRLPFSILPTGSKLRAFLLEIENNKSVERKDIARQLFIQKSLYYYKSLIAPIEQAGIQLKDRLLIIPDQYLGYLSFDMLLTEMPQDSTYATLPFLINQKAIGYAYSLNVLAYQQERSKTYDYVNRYVGIAPEINDIDNKRQIDTLAQTLTFMDQQLLFDDQATQVNTIMEVQKGAQIGCLAIHGHVANGKYWFEFLDGELTASDLVNKFENKFPINHMILSACEMGKGELQPGEGIFNFAMAFTEAGANSVAFSRWNARDESMKKLLYIYGQGLREGKPKDIALTEAKRALIKSDEGNGEANPYYWANLSLVGDYSSILRAEDQNPILRAGQSSYWLGLGGISLLLIFFSILRRTKKNA